MTKPQKADKAIEQHFFRALDVAILDKGMNRTQAEASIGLPLGTLSLWMGGKRTPSALRFAEVVSALGLNAGAIMNDGLRRAREAGLLDDVKIPPPPIED